jgi:hypothetical protein
MLFMVVEMREGRSLKLTVRWPRIAGRVEQ